MREIFIFFYFVWGAGEVCVYWKIRLSVVILYISASCFSAGNAL